MGLSAPLWKYSVFDMSFTQFVGLALICLICSVIMKNLGSKATPVLISVVVVGVIRMYGESLAELVGGLFSLADSTDGSLYIATAIKILGVGYVGGICSDVCRELGEGGLAGAVTLAARLETLVLTFPFIEKIMESVIECMI